MCPKQRFAAVNVSHQRSRRWAAELRPGRLTGSARVLPKLAVPVAVAAAHIEANHSHETPEITATPITDGNLITWSGSPLK